MEDKFNDSYVAFLDILGFKNIINNPDFNKIISIFNNIANARKAIESGALCKARYESDIETKNYNQMLEEAFIRIMSDSIVIAIPSKYNESLEAIITICLVTQHYLLSCEKPIYVRGAITKGLFYGNNEIMFGPALVDAYLDQENLSKYPRIIISKQLVNEVSRNKKINHLEKTKDDLYQIQTIKYYLDTKNKDNIIKIRNDIIETLNTSKDFKIREKYIWLKSQFNKYLMETTYIESKDIYLIE